MSATAELVLVDSDAQLAPVSQPFEGFLSIATRAAKLGIPVFPCRPCTKIPQIKQFQILATTNLAQIAYWGERFPNCNVGGLARRDDLLFLDEDDSERIRALYEQATGEAYPRTRTTESRPGHRQSAWRQTDKTRALLKNIVQGDTKDGMFSVRFDRELVLLDGSIHPTTGLPYVLVDDSPIVPMPDKLVEFIASLELTPEEKRVKREAAKNEKLSKAPATDTSTPPEYSPIPDEVVEGARNCTVSLYAWDLIQNDARCKDQHAFRALVHEFNSIHCVPPLGADEVDSIVRGKLDKKITGANAVNIGGSSASEAPRVMSPKERAEAAWAEIRTERDAKLPEFQKIAAQEAATRIGAQTAADSAADAERAKRIAIYAAATYDPSAPQELRQYHYDGILLVGYLCLWLGARKAEKSLFALWKAMCDACGANWISFQNMLGPVEVLYFDAEDHASDIDDRYREHIQAFTPEQQKLIKKNLHIKKGTELKQLGIDIEYTNAELWSFLAAEFPNVQSVYLDCWYELNSIKAGENVAARKAVEQFRRYFSDKTVFILHHTGNESKESRAKESPVWLRVMGAERWSGNISYHSVLTKLAELIICQERYEPKDDEGLAEVSFIDFQLFSRSSSGTPLLSFENDYGDETKGEEWKYRRKMITSLSQPALAILRALSGNGRSQIRFLSIPALFKSAGKQKSAREYRAVRELIIKGYILYERTADGVEYRLRDDGVEGPTANMMAEAAKSPAAQKSAGDFLKASLLFADKTPNPGVPRDSLQQAAQAADLSWDAVRQAKTRLGVDDETRGGVIYWKWPQKVKKSKKSRASEREEQPHIPF